MWLPDGPWWLGTCSACGQTDSVVFEPGKHSGHVCVFVLTCVEATAA